MQVKKHDYNLALNFILLEKHIKGKIVHHNFVEKFRKPDKQGKIHPNNKYIVVIEK